MIDFGQILKRFRRDPDLKATFQAFKMVFGTSMARKYVLPDLIQFSGYCVPAPESGDMFSQGRAAGRRDMMLRIQHYITLEEKDIYDMLKSNPLKPGDLKNG